MAIAEELASVAAALNRSTVQVRSGRMGVGSGAIWRSDGLIITNAHVVRGRRTKVELSDGRVFDAAVTARDDSRDLAALKVEAADLPAAIALRSDALRVGELVLAVGNPLGVVGALTTGIIHAIDSRWVMADIRLAPGNSGGPLADAQGRVIGINSMIVGGLGYAVPSNAVERFLLVPEERPDLGVTVQPVAVPLRYRSILGLLVLEVRSGSLAAEAGLLTGDVLIGVGGQLFGTPNDLTAAVSNAVGDTLQLDIMRGGMRICRSVVVRGDTSGVVAA